MIMDNYNYNKIVVDMKTLSQKQVKSKLFGKETFWEIHMLKCR